MKKLLLLFTALIFAGASAFAQGKTVSGVVLDNKTNEPLVGATIIVVGTTIGTVTDADGKFSLTLPEGSNSLKITYSGYTDVETSAKNNMTVFMEDKSETLKELTVEIFTGQKKGKGYAGSAQTISGETIEKKSPTDVTKSMAGEFAGVQVVTSTGQPGTSSSVRIHGFGSVNASTAPLYVVDGIPYSGDVPNIDPSDVASQTVLKDATATALYGARGANGVILITTKKGTAGAEGRIDVDLKYGINARWIPMYDVITDPKQYTEVGWSGLYTWGLIGGIEPYPTAATAATYAGNNLFQRLNPNGTMSGGGVSAAYNPFDANGGQTLIDPTTGKFYEGIGYKYVPENWAKNIFHTGKKYEATVKFSGGSEKTTYYTSVGFLNDEGYYIQSDFKRFTARSNLDFEPKKWLKGNLNIAYAYATQDAPGQGDNMNNGFQYVNGIPPIYPVYQHYNEAEGTIQKDPIYDPIIGGPAYDYGMYEGWGRAFGTGINPAGALRLDKLHSENHQLSINSSFTVEFYKDLQFIANIGFLYYGQDYSELNNKFYGDAEGVGRIEKGAMKYIGLTAQELLKYNKTIKDEHTVDAFIGHESTLALSSSYAGLKAQIFKPEDLEFSNASIINYLSSGSSRGAMEGYFAGAQYNYREKYFFLLNGRRDGSSVLSPNNRWSNFGSVGASWQLERESFMNKSKKWLSELKIKASYGLVGNSSIGNFGYTDLYALSSIEGMPALIWESKGAPSLGWEKKHMFNTGIEANIKKGRLIFEVEYYNNRTTDLLFPKYVAPSQGYGGYLVNDGVLRNQGVDFLVKAQIVKTRNVELLVRVNGTFNRSKMLQMPKETRWGRELPMINNGGLVVGKGLDEWNLPEYMGLNENGESLWKKYYDANNSAETGPGERQGYIPDVYFYTHQDTLIDGKVVLRHPNADIQYVATNDYGQAGNNYIGKRALPTVFGGLGIDFKVYGVEFSAMFSYQLGGYGYDNVYAQMMGDEKFGRFAWHKDMLNAWSPMNGSNDVSTSAIPRLTGGNATFAPYANAGSTRFLTSNSCLQLNNVRIAYNFPSKLVKKILLNSLNIWISADNLLVVSARKGYVPTSYFTGGSDRSQYIPLSTLIAGIKIQF
ncbi:MAG: SusC/RagA family TonB-linked outer membrane protein [Prevotellaceae bacterium]|jgi:TonB-linked SusC/RagA family outer membrane protein|nr:SusC/RagA family TonB-linked outer membrane protein [Prevotellaceae bacterium]